MKLLIVIWLLNIQSGLTQPGKVLLKNESKVLFDDYMEKLEMEIRKDNKKTACLYSSSAYDIIKKNAPSLKSLEPYYKWTEIRDVLISTQEEYCNG